jgi:hypothetical protein
LVGQPLLDQRRGVLPGTWGGVAHGDLRQPQGPLGLSVFQFRPDQEAPGLGSQVAASRMASSLLAV